MTVPAIIAHRGASAAFPENTVEAFAGARALGADGVELDVRRSADGALVVHHDFTLPDGRLLVETATADLPAHLPSLGVALDACAGMTVNVEIKNWPADPDFDPSETVTDGVVALLAEHPVRSAVLVSSFHLPTIDRVRHLDAELATAFLFAHMDPATALDLAVDHGHRVLHPWDGRVSEGLVAAAHDRAVAVNTWTVDDPARMVELARWGVDGVVTNVPDVARATLGGGDERPG